MTMIKTPNSFCKALFSRHVLIKFVLTYFLHFGLCLTAPVLWPALKGVSANWSWSKLQ